MAFVKGAESVVSTEEGAEDEDKPGSTCTTASLGSLASRIGGLAVDFGPKTQRLPEFFDEGSEEEEEEVVSITEEDIMQELEKTEPAFQVCSRLFKPLEASQRFKRLSSAQAKSLQQNGFLVVDNFLPQETAARLRADTMAFHRQGRLQEACNMGNNPSNDKGARGDWIMWLHAGTPPATSPAYSALLEAFRELQEDLAQLMHLRLHSCEHQLSFYPPNGSQYVRHRDAFPDDGNERDQRRVTAIAYANSHWRPQDGGKLRLWIPPVDRRSLDDKASSHSQASPPTSHHRSTTSDAEARPELCPDSLDSLPTQALGNGLPNGHTNGYANGHLDGSADGEWHHGSGLQEQPMSLRELHFMADRSGSLASSVVVEPTEASSIPDNASLDGNSVRSGGRSKHTEEVGSAAVLDVAPLAGRLVVFLSGAIEHAVLPNFSERIAITCWSQ